MPLDASLRDSERIKLLKGIASACGTDASAYVTAPATYDEFSGNDKPLDWEAGGWDDGGS